MNSEYHNSRSLCFSIGKRIRGLSLIRPAMQMVRKKNKRLILLFTSSIAVSFLIFGTIATILGISNHQAHILVRNALKDTNKTGSSLENMSRDRGIVMSCPVGQTQNHHGSWKPKNMVHGVEGVIQQLQSFDSDIPLFFGYYEMEKKKAEPWCRNISESYIGSVEVLCFKIPEQFPKDMYGYAKIYAIRHAPIEEALWLDCDVFPVRSLEPLFDDSEFKKTGAMFWPDSRDFFDEAKLASILNIERNSDIFPLNAWWVQQGFDSGLVLVNRKSCARQIEAMCRITRAPEMKILRDLSMGDKDMFHVVWMLHGKNFTLVPYLGESGNIQAMIKSRRAGKKLIRKSVPSNVRWLMSSQLKYGRDGEVYALHQLHRQPGFALIATLAEGAPFRNIDQQKYTSYVNPLVIVRKDLRLANIDGNVGGFADFVGNIESALIKGRKGKPRRLRTIEEKEGIHGFNVWRAPEWIGRAAENMSKSWKPKRRIVTRLQKMTHREARNALLTAVGTERYGKHVLNKLQRRLERRLKSKAKARKIE